MDLNIKTVYSQVFKSFKYYIISLSYRQVEGQCLWGKLGSSALQSQLCNAQSKMSNNEDPWKPLWCSHLFESPLGFSLGYSFSLLYIHEIFLKPFLLLKPLHLYVSKSIFQNTYCVSCQKCLPKWVPKNISPMCLPQNPAYIFSAKSFSLVCPRTYL